MPHELVSSFKSTLEETFHADLLLHIIDISNPLWEYQRKIVYSILDDIFPNKEYKDKIIEVFNKIDLIADLNDINEKINQTNCPVVPLSAKENLNFNGLTKQIQNKLLSVFNKSECKIEITFNEHYKVLEWIKKFVGEPSELIYSENGENVLISVFMDKNQKDAYLENFVIKRAEKKRKS